MLKGKAVSVKDLSEPQKTVMYSIMTEYYENITEQNFYSDLSKKVDAILLRDDNNVIHGFTTLAIYPHDEHTQLLFSGDTIVEREYWGANDLSHAWLNNALSHAEKFDGKTYWLLLTKGYKTYKFLPMAFSRFYPRADIETPLMLQEIIDTFSRAQFGNQYQNGVFVEGKDFLKEEFDDLNDSKLKDKNIAFFLAKNPGYKKGDELVCLCELTVGNLNRAGRRILGR